MSSPSSMLGRCAALGLFFILLAACRPGGLAVPFDADDPSAAAARLRQRLAKHPGDTAARRQLAHIQVLHLGQSEASIAHLDRLTADNDPLARLTRLILAEARLDASTVQRQAYALIEGLASAPAQAEDSFATGAAAFAARALTKVHGDHANDDERFVEFFARLKPRALPFGVMQPLVSLRAAIARRRGDDFRGYFATQGCVQQWRASEVLGTLGDYELRRQHDGPFVQDSTAKIVPLSCVTRVWNPTSRAGVRRLRTELTVHGDRLRLDMSAQERVRVYLDGTLIHRTDTTDSYAPRRTQLWVPVAPGRHELEVATSIGGEKAWVLVRAMEADGTAVKSSATAVTSAAGLRGKPTAVASAWGPAASAESPLSGSLYAPLRVYLAVDEALALGQSDRAEQLVTGLDPERPFAEGALLRARQERRDPSRTSSVSTAREQQALESALAGAPALDAARLRLLELMLARGEDAKVLEELAQHPTRLRGLRGQLLRYRANRARGNEHASNQSLALAAKINAENCRVLMAQRTIARDLDNVRREDEIAQALADCGGSLTVRARLAEARGRHEEARALWQQRLDRIGDDIEALEGLARLAAVMQDNASARKHLLHALSLSPLRAGLSVGLADLALSEGNRDAAKAQLRTALRRVPHSDGLHRAADSIGIADDLMDYRVDGLAAMRAYQASGAAYEGVSEVLVLDRSVVRVYSNGGQRQIVHLVVELKSKDSIDRYGEFAAPRGARLLTLRSIKPDGTLVEAELVPGKEAASLRKLKEGDFVEYEFIVESAPSYALPGYVDVSSFRFQSFDIPYHRSELLVVHPRKMAVKVDSRQNAPVASRQDITFAGEALTLMKFRADEVPRLGVEPGNRGRGRELPNVHVYTDLDVSQWLGGLAANIAYAPRTNPELRAHVRALLRGKSTTRSRVEVLWSWVVNNIEDGGDLSSSATATFSERAGNRLVLLWAMMSAAGIDHELWLARDKHGADPLPDGHPLVENYNAAMLAVPIEGHKEPLMVLTASKVMPLGYMAPGYSGSPAVRVPLEPGQRAVAVKLPGRPAVFEDKRSWDLVFELTPSGSGVVKGTVTLHGGEAVAWRQALTRVDRDRLHDVFVQAELQWLRAATLRSFEIRNEEALDLPLELHFVAVSDSVGIVQNGQLSLRTDLMGLNLGARYTTLPTRVTGLVVPYAPRYVAKLEFRLSQGAFSEVPPPVTISSKFGEFVRTVEGSNDGRVVTLRYDSSLSTGVVEPHRYDQMAAFTRQVQTASQAPLRAKDSSK